MCCYCLKLLVNFHFVCKLLYAEKHLQGYKIVMYAEMSVWPKSLKMLLTQYAGDAISIWIHEPAKSKPKFAAINKPAHDDWALFRFWSSRQMKEETQNKTKRDKSWVQKKKLKRKFLLLFFFLVCAKDFKTLWMNGYWSIILGTHREF